MENNIDFEESSNKQRAETNRSSPTLHELVCKQIEIVKM